MPGDKMSPPPAKWLGASRAGKRATNRGRCLDHPAPCALLSNFGRPAIPRRPLRLFKDSAVLCTIPQVVLLPDAKNEGPATPSPALALRRFDRLSQVQKTPPGRRLFPLAVL